MVVETQSKTLRRSQRERRYSITNDYLVFLQKLEINLRIHNDQIHIHKSCRVIILMNGIKPWKKS